MAVATEHLALPPAPAPQRRGQILVATFFAMAAGTVLMGALLGSFLAGQRDAGDDWLPAGVSLPNVALLVTYITLVFSSFTAQWAVSAIRDDERRQSMVATGLTVLLGAAFVNGMTFCWHQLGAAAGDGGYGNHMFAVTVTHTLLVLAAMVFFLVMGFRIAGGQFGPRNTEFVASAAAFWHFTVVAGFFVYYVLWFLQGGPGQ
jgi:heme/copper-type cytochrome/quinol oxidase subunit 3